MTQMFESKVPPRAVHLVKTGQVERRRKESNDQKEVWRVKEEYTVTMVRKVRAYNCTCRFGSVHSDKDGICKHVAAVELYKAMNYVNERIFDKIMEENKK